MEEDGVQVLPPPGLAGGPMVFPKEGQQIGIADALRIIIHLNGFRVIADVVIGGVRRPSAGVTDTGPNNPFQGPELGLDAPESPQTESRRRKIPRGGSVDEG